MENKKESAAKEQEQKSECTELSEEELKEVSGGKIKYPEQRDVN